MTEHPTPFAAPNRRGPPSLVLILGLVLLVATAVGTGYVVDRERTASLREILRTADALATQPVNDDLLLPYFTLHNHLAAAAGVEPCSAFALRMTQRFLPEGMHFHTDDVAAVERGEDLARIRMERGQTRPSTWECGPRAEGSESTF